MEETHGDRPTTATEMQSLSSLERLKALDTLPNRPTQLDTVRELCTHPARGEMISKWLLEKLRSSQEWQSTAAVWEALIASLRLLSPEKLATAIASSRFLEIVSATLQAADNATQLLPDIFPVWDFLFQLSRHPRNVGVKAALTLPAAQAARLAGVWLRTSGERVALGNHLTSNEAALSIDLALQVWAYRKASPDDNDLFAQSCLAPAAFLLALIPREDAVSGSKRRLQEYHHRPQSRSALEVILARHVFLPSRVAFFRARQQADAQGDRPVGSQRPRFTMESMLEPLKEALASRGPHKKTLLGALPLLLDISLRCVHTPSPRQRIEERPWTEAVLESIHECCPSEMSENGDHEVLVDMLAVISKRAALSQEALRKLVQLHTGLGTDATDGGNWPLIAKIVMLDAHVFTATDLATSLFSHISSADGEFRRELAGGNHAADRFAAETVRTLWQHDILRPLTKAFAQSRQMNNYLDLWLDELSRLPPTRSTLPSVWETLESEMQPLVEESLTGTEISKLVRRHYTFLANVSKTPGPDEFAEIYAHVVVLSAIMGGLYSEDVLDRLEDVLQPIYQSLLRLTETSAPGAGVPRLRQTAGIWNLLRRSFELWFPVWASKQHEKPAVAAQADSIFPLQLVTQALTSEGDSGLERAARRFACCILSHMLEYREELDENVRKRCLESLSDLAARLGDDASLLPLTLYPKLLAHMDETSRLELFARCIENAEQESDAVGESRRETFRAIIASTSQGSMSRVIDSFLTVCVDKLEQTQGHDSLLAAQGVTIMFLLEAIPPTSLARERREGLLNVICRTRLDYDASCHGAIEQTLSLIIHFTQAPNPTAELMIGPGFLLKLGRAIDETTSESRRLKLWRLFDELVIIIIRQVIEQGYAYSWRMLEQLSNEAEQSLHRLMQCEDHTSPEWRCGRFSRALICRLEGTVPDDDKWLRETRSAHVAQSIVTWAVARIEPLVSEVLPSDGEAAKSARLTQLSRVLGLLIAMPESLTSTMDLDLKPVAASLIAFASDQARNCADGGRPNRTEELEPTEQALVSTLVQCFVVGCMHSGNDGASAVVGLGQHLLRCEIPPPERANMLATFDGFLRRADAGARLAATAELLSVATTSADPASVVTLVERCLASLGKSDFEDHSSPSPQATLQQLLQLVVQSPRLTSTRRALGIVDSVFREKHFMVNQYNVETALQVLHGIARQEDAGSVLFLDLCKIANTLLLNHRARLQGRFHSLIKLLQALTSRLFVPLRPQRHKRPPLCRTLTSKHAHALSRLCTLFAAPPQLRKSSAAAATLVDESRKQQAHVGRFAPYVLHHHCTQALHGALGDGMREALQPGLWAMVEACEIGDAHGVAVLSASMDNSERAVLRALYDDWKAVGKWKGS